VTKNLKMKYLKIIILLILCFPSIARSQDIKLFCDKIIELFENVNIHLNDTNFITYPYVTSQICVNWSEFELKKYGFSADQFCRHSKDSFSLVGNKYFEVIESDSILRYHTIHSEIKNGVILFQPFRFYVKLRYKKGVVRYFSVPIFSKNSNYAVVKYEDLCGEDCGSGAIFIMEKQKTKWTVINTIIHIMI
jgi:hypothetical protein